jgi:hydrogenase-1 operon protein HyaF
MSESLANLTVVATEPAPPVSPHDDPDCLYTAMPQGMQTFAMPSLFEWRDSAVGADLLGWLETSLQANLRGEHPEPLDLTGGEQALQRFVNEVLGEGEVIALGEAGAVRLMVRETVVPGIWHVRRFEAGRLQRAYLETGPLPRALLAWAQNLHGGTGLTEPSEFPADLMNAPALIHEIFVKAAAFAPGREETLNLSLLPLTAEDLKFLVATLGLAGVSILSKGYGDCRISLTGLPHVWWVQHFNSTEQLILNTLEITEMPVVAMAAREDLEDALERVRDMRADLLGREP